FSFRRRSTRLTSSVPASNPPRARRRGFDGLSALRTGLPRASKRRTRSLLDPAEPDHACASPDLRLAREPPAIRRREELADPDLVRLRRLEQGRAFQHLDEASPAARGATGEADGRVGVVTDIDEPCAIWGRRAHRGAEIALAELDRGHQPSGVSI